MDFMKILRSFEDFIFEATSWLVFYPLTMWRIIRRPLATMDYSDREQSGPEERRYDDALSPPLLLLITIVLTNVIAMAAHVPRPEGASEMSRTILDSQENLALFRSLMFSLIPLVAATSLLHRQGKQISRQALQPPFYAQCYLAAPCAVFISLGGAILQRPDLPNVAGLVVMTGGAVWFLSVQTVWFSRKLATSRPKAALITLWAVVRATAYLLVIAAPVAMI